MQIVGGNNNASVYLQVTCRTPPMVGTLPPPTGTGIAASYPKDVGIAAHPAVVFTEEFDDSIAGVNARWTNHLEKTSVITTDVPAGSVAGSHSIAIPRTLADTGGYFFKGFTQARTELYVRYYIKPSGPTSHQGVWIGGENVGFGVSPQFPDPHAGVKPCRVSTGECTTRQLAAWFWSSAEPDSTGWFNTYSAFLNMRLDGTGTYWGNLLAMNTTWTLPANVWSCVEHRVKLNTVGQVDGEYAVWLNDAPVAALGKGFPLGSWVGGKWTASATGAPFEGLEWRDTTAFGINYLWLQNYTTPAGATTTVWYDHLVAATQRIGGMVA